MNRRRSPVRIERVFVWATASSLAAVPLVILALQAVLGTPRPLEVLAGAVVATAFFGATNLTILLHERRSGLPGLQKTLVRSYVVKTLVLVAGFYALGQISLDRTSFGIAVAASGVTFVLVQGVLGARRTPI